jgi:circadian clock protein KaiC
MAEPSPKTLERLSTGNAALDRILGGGVPNRSVLVIAGAPGTGKSVLALQLIFALARHGKKALYYSTLSEPAHKLIHYTQLFSFFDPALVDHRVIFADLGHRLRADGPEPALGHVLEQVEREEPDLVVIDSFKAIHDMVADRDRGRRFAYELAVSLSAWNATTILVGEYTSDEVGILAEFAIADGIIRLTNHPQELTASRQLEVLKLRGTGYITGRHFFDIAGEGIAVFPRVTAPEPTPERGLSLATRVSTGVRGLDDLLGGGLPAASVTIVQGSTGIGKTLLSLHFLVDGAARGERGILFTLEETPDQIRSIGRGFGWDLPAFEAEGRLTIEYTSPVELSTDRFLYSAQQRIASVGAQRAMLDSVSTAALGVSSERRFREMIYALCKHVRRAGVTLIMTMEVGEVLGSVTLGGHGISAAADNIVLLRYLELAGGLQRAIAVLKARGVQHRTELRRLTIGAEGVQVGSRFSDLFGVLTGIPQRVSRRRKSAKRQSTPRKGRRRP